MKQNIGIRIHEHGDQVQQETVDQSVSGENQTIPQKGEIPNFSSHIKKVPNCPLIIAVELHQTSPQWNHILPVAVHFLPFQTPFLRITVSGFWWWLGGLPFSMIHTQETSRSVQGGRACGSVSAACPTYQPAGWRSACRLFQKTSKQKGSPVVAENWDVQHELLQTDR